MKPIKLVMSAFGSYQGLTEIDFTKVDQGVFLITGDTGSGKTTIFDAITYALYDETSGGMRNGSMMRSQYAKETERTFVEFSFSYRGEIYTVKRNPEYRILKELKNGKVREQKVAAAVELTIDGNPFLAKKAETDAKLIEIIGLDVKQFTQIAMIAQGDFLKLLYTKTEERKKILSKIFKTSLYNRIQENVKLRSYEVQNALGENERAILQETSKICVMGEESEKWKEQLKELKERTLLPVEEYQSVLTEICACIKETAQSEKDKAKVLEKEEKELTAKLAKAEDHNKLFERLQEAETSLDALKEQEETLKNAEKAASEKRKKEEPIWQEKRIAANQALLQLKEVEQKESEKRKCEEEVTTLRENTKKAECELAKLIEKQEQFKQQIQLLKAAETDLVKAKAKEKDAVTQREELEILLELIRREKQETCVLEEKRKELARAIGEAEEKTLRYEKDYALFLSEQAGILAKDLKEGTPCPVCGAKEHPKLARLKEGAPSEAVIEKEKAESDVSKENREQCNLAFTAQREKVTACKIQRKEQWQRCLKEAESTEKADVSEEKIEQLFAAAKEREEQLNKEVKEAEEKEKKRKLYTEYLEQGQHALEEKETEFLENKEAFAQKNLEFITLEKEISVRKEGIAFGERKEAEAAYTKAEQTIKKLEKEETDAKNACRNWEEETNTYKGTTTALKKALRGKTYQPLDELKRNLAEKKKAKENCEKKWNELQIANKTNEVILKEIERYKEERNELEAKDQIAGILHQTFNGKIAKATKIDLETYVQRQYFKQIIAQANKRLLTMSSGQFLLQLKSSEDAGKGKNEGLDLAVYSLVTDTVRDVRTLSGGEAFLAALSMALGLSDIVGRTAGAVHLDMMFIDEGFGSLDERALEQAIAVLRELAGEQRVVGIISHVSELKESIEKKLVVRKSDCGSSVAWE